jgi:hypothetical protein
MEIEVHLDADVEILLKQQASERRLDFDRVLNDAIRAGLAPRAPATRPRFAQPTFHLGTDRIELSKALALADELIPKKPLS